MSARLFREAKCLLDTALSFFYPEVCQICDNERATAGEGFVGERCREGIRWIQPPFCERCGLPFEGDLSTPFECSNCLELELHFCHARSAVAARGTVLEVLHRYKYQRALWFEPFLAGLLIDRAAPALRQENWDMIVPVPLHGLKQSEREFNQAERLARRLSAATGIPLRARLLNRVESTRTQTQLSRAERAANVRRAFVVRHKAPLQQRNVVVVDDVLTTGATTSACAKVLLDAGASKVCAWTVARGLLN